MKFKTPPDKIWDTYWLNVYNRIERGIGWILLSIGAMILLAFGGYHFVINVIADKTLPLIIRIGILSALAGLVVLFVSVVREKILLRKSDPYSEVQR